MTIQRTRKQKIGAFLSVVTGFRTIKRSVISGVNVAALPLPIFRDFIKQNTVKIVRTPVGKVKNMQAAYRFALSYYGYTNEEQEIRQLKGRRNLAYTYTLGLIASTAWAIYSVAVGDSYISNTILLVMAYFSLPFLCLSQGWQAWFYYAQMKHRRLFSFAYWLKNPLILFQKPIPTDLTDAEYEYYIRQAGIIHVPQHLALPNEPLGLPYYPERGA